MNFFRQSWRDALDGLRATPPLHPFRFGKGGSTPNFNARAAIRRRCLITDVWDIFSREAMSRAPKPSARQNKISLSVGVSHFESNARISLVLTNACTDA